MKRTDGRRIPTTPKKKGVTALTGLISLIENINNIVS